MHTFEGWFCSAKLFNFLFFRYCTFLYRSILEVLRFCLCFSYLRNLKTLPHEFFTNEVLTEIGKVHGKSVAQIALRFLLQRGVVIIPKSTHKERMAENINIFDFELSADEMARIEALDTRQSLFFDHHDGEVTKMFMGWRGLA